MQSKNAIDTKLQELESGLQNQTTFFVEDAAQIWSNIEKSTVYWYLSALIEAGHIKRIRKGLYTLNPRNASHVFSLSQTAQEVKDILAESGFYYYISGLDILAGYMLHVPEQYPTILFVEREAKDEIVNILTRRKLWIIEPQQIKGQKNNIQCRLSEAIPIMLYSTNNFNFSTNGLAEIEKAFVDLYYAVTRNEYPLSIQELERIYENMLRTGAIDTKRMIRAANLRSIQYDIRFIAESKFITDKAKEFEKLLKERQFTMT